jgi:hypothetical protein
MNELADDKNGMSVPVWCENIGICWIYTLVLYIVLFIISNNVIGTGLNNDVENMVDGPLDAYRCTGFGLIILAGLMA